MKNIIVKNIEKQNTVFSVVRYGNVVGSRGSVIPYFNELIETSFISHQKWWTINNSNQYKSFENLQDLDSSDRKNTIKQKVVDLFSDIELNGYFCQIDWFLVLSLRRLKELYKQFEDIWNYRLQLTQEVKNNICVYFRDFSILP